MGEEKCAYDNLKTCPGVQKVNMSETQVREYRMQARKTHEKIYARLNDLEKSETARNIQYATIIEKLDKLLAWQEEQQSRPARRWETVLEKRLMMAVAAVAAFLLGRLGL